MFFKFFKPKQLENEVEKVLASNTVSKAQKLMRSRSGLWLISAISFFEAALPLPLVTDPFLVGAVLADRVRVVRIVLATTIASVLGGVFAYYSAALFIEVIFKLLTPNMVDQFNSLIATNSGVSTFALTMAGAVTPVPYTMACWVVGVLKGNILVFIVASIIGRGARYVIVGYSVYKFGPLAISYAKRYLGIASIVTLVLVGLFVWHKM